MIDMLCVTILKVCHCHIMIDMLCVTMCMQVQFYHEKSHSLDVKVDSGLSPSTLTHRCVFVCVCVCVFGGGCLVSR